jgi:hypothetical protein
LEAIDDRTRVAILTDSRLGLETVPSVNCIETIKI